MTELLVIGHGSRDSEGVAEYWRFADLVREEAEGAPGFGFIELVEPDLDTAIDKLVADGATSIAGVPLLLLGAGHLKNDGPAALARGEERHPSVSFTYGRQLGIHPTVLEVAEERIHQALEGVEPDGADEAGKLGVIVVGRGASDPDANSDLYKVTRLLQEGRGLDIVEPSFISLAEPSVPAALERCRLLGAETIVVVPYFLFTGVLVRRITSEAEEYAAEHPELRVRIGAHLGADRRLAKLVIERHREATEGDIRQNCDTCVYRTALPGHEDEVGQVLDIHGGHHHDGDDHHHDHS